MKQRVFNLIILDESGSMCTIERQAVNGVNETIQTIKDAQQKHENQEHLLSLVSFNTKEIKTIYDRVGISEAEELQRTQYNPSCGTPLYDAMGAAITALRPNVAPADAVLVTVITDGEENSSREYNGHTIKSFVESLKADGWVFTYIGANQDVERVAATISITNTLNFKASCEGTDAMFAKEKQSRSRWFDRLSSGMSSSQLSEDYFAD